MSFVGFTSDEKKDDVKLAVEEVDSDTEGSFTDLVAEDHEHEISLRTMSWQKAAWLLAGEQVCLAIMAQSWSLSYVPTAQYASNARPNMSTVS